MSLVSQGNFSSREGVGAFLSTLPKDDHLAATNFAIQGLARLVHEKANDKLFGPILNQLQQQPGSKNKKNTNSSHQAFRATSVCLCSTIFNAEQIFVNSLCARVLRVEVALALPTLSPQQFSDVIHLLAVFATRLSSTTQQQQQINRESITHIVWVVLQLLTIAENEQFKNCGGENLQSTVAQLFRIFPIDCLLDTMLTAIDTTTPEKPFRAVYETLCRFVLTLTKPHKSATLSTTEYLRVLLVHKRLQTTTPELQTALNTQDCCNAISAISPPSPSLFSATVGGFFKKNRSADNATTLAREILSSWSEKRLKGMIAMIEGQTAANSTPIEKETPNSTENSWLNTADAEAFFFDKGGDAHRQGVSLGRVLDVFESDVGKNVTDDDDTQPQDTDDNDKTAPTEPDFDFVFDKNGDDSVGKSSKKSSKGAKKNKQPVVDDGGDDLIFFDEDGGDDNEGVIVLEEEPKQQQKQQAGANTPKKNKKRKSLPEAVGVDQAAQTPTISKGNKRSRKSAAK